MPLKNLPWYVKISHRGNVVLREFMKRVEREPDNLDFHLDVMPLIVACVHAKYRRLPLKKRLALSVEVTTALELSHTLDNLPTTGWRQ